MLLQDWDCLTHPNRRLFPLCVCDGSGLKPQIIPFITNEKLESRNICYFCTRKKEIDDQNRHRIDFYI